MIIRIPFPSLKDSKRTYLTSSVAASGTALTVASNAGFSADDYFVKSEIGTNKSEIKKISTVAGSTTINSAAVTFAATEDTPITFIKYNQYKVYLGDYSARYSTGTIDLEHNSKIVTGNGTTWTGLTTASAFLINGEWYDIASVDSATQITLKYEYRGMDLDNASYDLIPFTAAVTNNLIVTGVTENTWDDTDAIAEDYYRYSYYNSTSTLESVKSVPISAVDLMDEIIEEDEYSLGKITQEVLGELNDVDQKTITKEDIRGYFNDVHRILTSKIIDINKNLLTAYKEIDLIADVSSYILPDDFREIVRVQIDYSGSGDYRQARPERINIDNTDYTYSESDPYYTIIGYDIQLMPTPETAITDGLKIWYKKFHPTLKEDGDQIPQVLRPYKHLYKYYIKSQYYTSPSGKSMNQYYAVKKDYDLGISDMVNELSETNTDRNQRIVDIEFEDQ